MNSPQKNIYFKNLDTLRLLTFFLVFIRHGFFTNDPVIEQKFLVPWRDSFFNFASIGLDFFSVLSSFLITWLILKEYDDTDKFNLKNFYMRRILRIWPLYFLIVGIGYIIVPFVSESLGMTPPQLPPIGWFLFFGVNYYVGYIDQDFLFFLAFLWFISVEEQFYLVWGLLLKFFKKYLKLICLILVLVYISVKYIYFRLPFPSFYDTQNYLPNFAAGAFLAYSYINRTKLFDQLKNLPKYVWGIVYVIFILSTVFYNSLYVNIHADHFKHIILSIIFSLILFEQCFAENALFSFSRIKIFNYLGKLNYGLYCWHGVVITIIKKGLEALGHKDTYIEVFLIYPIVSLTLTIILSILSYELFEKLFLRLKRYFRSETIKEEIIDSYI